MLNFKSEMCPEKIKGGGGEGEKQHVYEKKISVYFESKVKGQYMYLLKSHFHISLFLPTESIWKPLA